MVAFVGRLWARVRLVSPARCPQRASREPLCVVARVVRSRAGQTRHEAGSSGETGSGCDRRSPATQTWGRPTAPVAGPPVLLSSQASSKECTPERPCSPLPVRVSEGPARNVLVLLSSLSPLPSGLAVSPGTPVYIVGVAAQGPAFLVSDGRREMVGAATRQALRGQHLPVLSVWEAVEGLCLTSRPGQVSASPLHGDAWPSSLPYATASS